MKYHQLRSLTNRGNKCPRSPSSSLPIQRSPIRTRLQNFGTKCLHAPQDRQRSIIIFISILLSAVFRIQTPELELCKCLHTPLFGMMKKPSSSSAICRRIQFNAKMSREPPAWSCTLHYQQRWRSTRSSYRTYLRLWQHIDTTKPRKN